MKCNVHGALRHYQTTVLLGYFNMPRGIAHHSGYMWFNSFFKLRCKHVFKKKNQKKEADLKLIELHCINLR